MSARVFGGLLLATCAACAAAPRPRPVVVDALLPGLGAPPRPELLPELERLERQDAAFLAARSAARYVDRAHAEAFAHGVSELAAAALPGDSAAWIGFARDGAARGDLHRRLREAREQVAAALQAGDLATAVAIAEEALEEAPAGLAAGVARAWWAFALAVSGEPPSASVEHFAEAVRELAPASPVLAAQVGLLAHAIHADAAIWREAVLHLVDAHAAAPALCTPGLWQRALATRPAEATWPVEATDAWRVAVGADAAAFGAASEAELLRYAIAACHHRRGDPLAALVAFRQLEHSDLAAVRGLAAIGQAKALSALGQSGDARAVLAACIASSEPMVHAAGLAQLGAVELAADRTAVAEALLREALAVDGVDWADRAGAIANRAILRELGEEADAPAAFAAARSALAAAADVDGLLLCLENEASLCSIRDPQRAAAAGRLLEATMADGLAAIAR